MLPRNFPERKNARRKVAYLNMERAGGADPEATALLRSRITPSARNTRTKIRREKPV